MTKKEKKGGEGGRKKKKKKIFASLVFLPFIFPLRKKKRENKGEGGQLLTRQS